MAKSIPEYYEKCKLQQDRLVINGISYTIKNLHKLPHNLSAYKAAQKSNENIIGFFGELSPWSNFHYSPFTLENTVFPTAEHWIQYSKAWYFNDNVIAEAILNCETAVEVKRLGYQVSGFDSKVWSEIGYEICYKGVRAKFEQNADLFKMLKTTSPKLLVESSKEKLWGIGDTHVLN